jgi:hypothetical protein
MATTPAFLPEYHSPQRNATRAIAKLQSRAESAERYAAAAAVVPLAAVDEAEQASFEAWLTRKDADSAQGAKAP